MTEPTEGVRVLRIMEYLYTDSKAALQDRMNWATPANGVKKWNDRETIRSSTMDEEYVELNTAGLLAIQELQKIRELVEQNDIEASTAVRGVFDLVQQLRGWKDMYEEAKQGIEGAAPEYVYKIIDALVGAQQNDPETVPPLDFEGSIVPPEIQGYLVGKGFDYQPHGRAHKDVLGD